jgi:hypothetical protein
MGEEQEQACHVVAGAVLAGEQVKEFSLVQAFAVLALVLTKLPGLPEDFFMRDRP